MKKSKLVTGFSAAFVALMALVACGGTVRAKDYVVLTINGVDYTAEELFNDQKTPAAAEAQFNAVYKVAVRNYFAHDGSKFMDEITRNTKIKISGQKDVAQSNASKNGTTYAEEWQKILDSNSVDDEQGLYDKFEYELEKEKFDDTFYENNMATLKHGGVLGNESGQSTDKEYLKGYIPGKHPYHVKHILVKTGSSISNTAMEIDEAAAKKISDVVLALARGMNFADVAREYSDDTGSKDKGGDLGIMDLDTSFVSEFKLGTYLYEAYFRKNTHDAHDNRESPTEGGGWASEKALTGLNLDVAATNPTIASERAKSLANDIIDPSNKCEPVEGNALTGIGQIPVEAAFKLGKDWVNVTSTKIVKGYGNITPDREDYKWMAPLDIDMQAKYYPRNILFNKYFNKRNVSVITARRLDLQDVEKSKDYALIGEYTDIERDAQTKALSGGKIIKVSDTGIGATAHKNTFIGVNDDDYKAMKGFKTPGTDTRDKDGLVPQMKDNSENSDISDILCDEKGNIIFVFRAGTSDYQGIHFVCIERSPFMTHEWDGSHKKDSKPDTVSLDEYFTTKYPTKAGKNEHPTYGDDTNKQTYVTYFPNDVQTALKSRADDVKNKVKGGNTNLETYVYRFLTEKADGSQKIVFTDKAKELGIDKNISAWIESKREATVIETADNWDQSWDTYYDLVTEATNKRKQEDFDPDATYDFRGGTVPEIAAVFFANISEGEKFVGDTTTDYTGYLKALFGKGGVFHD